MPVAMRCQRSLSPTGSTIHTSPSHEQRAMRPSGKKSRPEKRVCASQGLVSGALSRSTAKGPLSFPFTTMVSSFWGQRDGPPRVRGTRSRSLGARLMTGVALPSVWVYRQKRRVCSPAGIFKRNLPPSATQVTGESAGKTPASSGPAEGPSGVAGGPRSTRASSLLVDRSRTRSPWRLVGTQRPASSCPFMARAAKSPGTDSRAF